MTEKDLEAQLAAYTQQLDAHAPSSEELAPDPSGHPALAADVVELPTRRQSGWFVGGAAAALVALMIGSVALFASLRDNESQPVTTSPPTTAVVDSGPVAVLVSPEPVIGHQSPEEGQLVFFTMGDVKLVDGVFHTLLGVERKPPGFYHASSEDGSTWVVDETQAQVGDFEGIANLRATEFIELDDGTWAGYFDLGRDLGGFGDHRYRYWVHRGTAPAIEGPWTIDSEPVLDAGDPGTWDAGWVRNASVVRDGDDWTMFYLGSDVLMDGAGAGAVGVARSSDGIVWEKESDPVFVADDSRFEDGGFSRLEVKWIDDEFLMTYAGRTGGNRGLATSPDGGIWVRESNNPVLTTIEVPRGSIYDTALVQDGDTLRWYVGAGGFESMAVYEMRLDR